MTMCHSFVVVVAMTKCQGLNTVKTKEVVNLFIYITFFWKLKITRLDEPIGVVSDEDLW